MKLALVGATGMVGQVMCRILEERNFPVYEFIPVASENSIGKTIKFHGMEYPIVSVETAIAQKPDVALFSAGSSVSLKYAPEFANVGTLVIDNSSAWRMDPNIPLVVPEINGKILQEKDKIIANPNCSTIQLAMTIQPIHQKYGIDRMVVSTYQSVTGTGVKAYNQLLNERNKQNGLPAYPHQIDLNCLPHCDVFLENDYTREEIKVVNESRKILNDANLKITCTAVRIPVIGGHSEAVNLALQNPFTISEIKNLLAETPGLTVLDNPSQNEYPTPLMAQGKDDVFVGRIRRDESLENALNLWIVSDNLRKGAATNAVQIAEYCFEKEFISDRKYLIA